MILEPEVGETYMIPIRKDQHRVIRQDETSERVTIVIESLELKPSKPIESDTEGET